MNYFPLLPQTMIRILTNLDLENQQPTSFAPKHHLTNIKYTVFLALCASTFNLLFPTFPTSQAHTLNQLEQLRHYRTVKRCVVATKCNSDGNLLTFLTINITQEWFLGFSMPSSVTSSLIRFQVRPTQVATYYLYREKDRRGKVLGDNQEGIMNSTSLLG